MDYKEEYQKALERAKKGLPIDEVFPELKESDDERIRKFLVELVSNDKANNYNGLYIDRGVRFDDVLAYLERQKEQQPAEWSEEDNRHINTIIRAIHGAGNITPIEGELAEKWFKSLRPSWKPSEEQLSMLLAVINEPNNAGSESCQISLKSIYNDIKKL